MHAKNQADSKVAYHDTITSVLLRAKAEGWPEEHTLGVVRTVVQTAKMTAGPGVWAGQQATDKGATPKGIAAGKIAEALYSRQSGSGRLADMFRAVEGLRLE